MYFETSERHNPKKGNLSILCTSRDLTIMNNNNNNNNYYYYYYYYYVVLCVAEISTAMLERFAS